MLGSVLPKENHNQDRIFPKIESVAATANALAMDVQSHFTQYLLF